MTETDGRRAAGERQLGEVPEGTSAGDRSAETSPEQDIERLVAALEARWGRRP